MSYVRNLSMSKITHIGRNFSDMNSDSKKPWELFPGLEETRPVCTPLTRLEPATPTTWSPPLLQLPTTVTCLWPTTMLGCTLTTPKVRDHLWRGGHRHRRPRHQWREVCCCHPHHLQGGGRCCQHHRHRQQGDYWQHPWNLRRGVRYCHTRRQRRRDRRRGGGAVGGIAK